MNKRLILPWTLLIVLGCAGRNPLYHRITSDYFPLNEGNQWVYDQESGGQQTIRIDQRTVWSGREAFLVDEDGTQEYWFKDGATFQEYFRGQVLINGDAVTVGEVWETHLKLPLLLGNAWQTSYESSTSAWGEVLHLNRVRRDTVLAVETIGVPAGTFQDCYKLREETQLSISSPLLAEPVVETSETFEWFAPGVGMVKRQVSGGETWELVSYALY